MPNDNVDLENGYTAQEIINISISDNEKTDQTATLEYAIHQFKDAAEGENNCKLTCECSSTLSPTFSTVYLQIYNVNSSTWETLGSNNTAGADEDFTLEATVINLTNYKDNDGVVTCRLYQLMTGD